MDRDSKILRTSDWKSEVNESALTDTVYTFIDRTDFSSTSVVLVEYGMATSSNELQLTSVSLDAETATIDFNFIRKDSGVQSEGTHLVAIRIDETVLDSATVCVERDDSRNCF